jgi:hypothetical protein
LFSCRKDELFQNAIATYIIKTLDKLIKYDKRFSTVFPVRNREEDMQVVNRRKLLPDVTIGLTKEEACKLAKVLGESNVEVSFCLELLSDIDLVALEEKIVNK